MMSPVGYYFIFSGLESCFGHSKHLQGFKVILNTAQVTFNFLQPNYVVLFCFVPTDKTQDEYLFQN